MFVVGISIKITFVGQVSVTIFNAVFIQSTFVKSTVVTRAQRNTLNVINFVGFEVFTAVTMKTAFFVINFVPKHT
jgi:hypothetical protein